MAKPDAPDINDYFKLLDALFSELYTETIWHKEFTQPCFDALDGLSESYPDFSDTEKAQTLAWLSQHLPGFGQNEPLRAFVLSIQFHLSRDPAILDALLDIAMDGTLVLEDAYFLYWQIGRQIFLNSSIITTEQRLRFRQLYYKMLSQCRDALPQTHRDKTRPANENLVVILTAQFLKARHAPTADTLDFCLVLKQQLYKDVILIHTADHARDPRFPFYNFYLSNYLPEYNSQTEIAWEGERFPFAQVEQPMPDLPAVAELLNALDELRPGLVLSLGGTNLTADLASQFLRVATIPFGTDLPVAAGGLWVVPGPLTHHTHLAMETFGIPKERVLESRYYYGLPKRGSKTYTRADWNLKDTDFVLAIVGYRLAMEVTPEFLTLLTRLCEAQPNVCPLFMGEFDEYQQHLSRFPLVYQRAVNVGFQEDVLAIYDLCNVYLNPPRSGGGSSGAYALGAGLPVICLSQGDVSNVVGSDRVFGDFDAVMAYTARCQADTAFYRQEVEQARQTHFTISDRRKWLSTIMAYAKMHPPGFSATLLPNAPAGVEPG